MPDIHLGIVFRMRNASTTASGQPIITSHKNTGMSVLRMVGRNPDQIIYHYIQHIRIGRV